MQKLSNHVFICVAEVLVTSAVQRLGSHSELMFQAVVCCGVQAGSQYRRYAEPAGQMQNGKWVSAKNKAGLTLRFENSGGKPPGPYCRNLDEAPAEGEVWFLRLP